MVGPTFVGLAGCGTVLGLNEYEITEGDGDTGGQSSGGNGGSVSSMCAEDCDDENDCTIDSCVKGECAHVTVMAGETCDGGVCNGVSGGAACVRCIDDAAGESQDSGCPETAPQCDTEGNSRCTGCDTHADCDDANECTQDTCNSKGECQIATQPAGTACNGGVCNGAPEAEACEACLDDAAGMSTDTGCKTGTPLCDETAKECVECVDDATGTAQDLGCSGDAPLCDKGLCVECTGPEHCNDSVACTVDSCDAGACVHAADDSQCSYNPLTDKCGTCNPALGCEDGSAPAQEDNLLQNAAFDDGLIGWTQQSTCCENGIIVDYAALENDSFPVHTASQLAWLGGTDGETSILTQSDILLPPGTVGLRLLVHLYRETEETDDDDQSWATLRAADDSESVDVFHWYSHTSTWAAHEEVVDVHDWGVSTVDLEFRAVILPSGPENYSSFMLDTLSLNPLVCH